MFVFVFVFVLVGTMSDGSKCGSLSESLILTSPPCGVLTHTCAGVLLDSPFLLPPRGGVSRFSDTCGADDDEEEDV